MKKFLTITLLTLVMMAFVACGGNSSGKKDKDPTDPTNPTEEPTDNPTDNPSEPTESTEEDDGCTGISIDWSQLTMYQSNFFYLGEDPAVYLEFYQNENYTVSAGTYDLGTENNTNYKTCSECVRYLTDYVEATDTENGHYNHIYFQKSGTLTIDGVDDNGNIKGTIAAKLIEVTIDPDEFTSTPVEGGACFKIESATFDSGWEEPCVPQCEGKKCGADGCGGTCGTCEGQACSADFQCVPFNCDKLGEVSEFEFVTEDSWFGTNYYYDAYTTGKGIGSESIPDLLEIGFALEEGEELKKGTVTLTGDTKNISDAYVFLYEDYDMENYEIGKYYFQESGTLNFTEVKEGTLESKGNGSFRLVEIDTDYIPVAGGKCYEVKDITWDTICVPKCEGKICGPDGCGGTCGDGCGEDKTCNAEQTQCVDFDCKEITFEEGSYNASYGIYIGSYTPNTSEDDMYLLETWTTESDTYNLYGTNYKDCELCFVISEGEDTSYFQQKGTVVFSTQESAAGTNVTAKISGLRLEEVTIASDYSSTPVAGGACYDVKDTTITYTASEEDGE